MDDKQVVRDAHHGAARVDGEREFAHHKVTEELVEEQLLPLCLHVDAIDRLVQACNEDIVREQ